VTSAAPTPPSARSFTVRYLTLFGGEAVSKLCVMAAFAYLAHVLTPGEYGTVELALSITLFFVLSVESGMGLYGASQLAAAPARLSTLVPQVMVLRLLLGAPLFALLLAVAWRFAPAFLGILSVNGLAVLLTPFLVQWVFQGLRQMQWVAAGSALRNLTFVALVLLLVGPGADIRLAAVAEVGGITALAVFNLVVLRTRIHASLDWRGSVAGARQLFSRIWFMGFGDLTWACIWYGPAVVLRWMDLPDEVAWITASVRVVVALHTFVWLYFFNLLPNLSKELATGVDAWRRLVSRSLGAALWPALLIAVAGSLGAPVVMPLVFGSGYAAAILPAQIAVWMIPITWYSGHFRFSLIAAGRQRNEVVISAISAVAGVAGALVLGRTHGGVGAAAALAGAGVLNALLATLAASRLIGAVGVGANAIPVVVVTIVSLAIGFATTSAAGALAGAAAGCVVFAVAAVRYNNELVRTLGGLVTR